MTSVVGARGRASVAEEPAAPWRTRFSVASRIVAAVGMGYAAAATSAAFLAVVLPMGRPEAVTTATLISPVVDVCAVLWVFAARSATWAWIGLVVPTALMGLVIVMAGGR